MTDYIERAAAIAAAQAESQSNNPYISGLAMRIGERIRAIPSAPSQREAAIRERIGEVRLFLDTGFLQLGVTIDYDPADIARVLAKLDAILAILDQPAVDPVAKAARVLFTEQRRLRGKPAHEMTEYEVNIALLANLDAIAEGQP